MKQSKRPSTSCSRVAWTSIGEAPVADGRCDQMRSHRGGAQGCGPPGSDGRTHVCSRPGRDRRGLPHHREPHRGGTSRSRLEHAAERPRGGEEPVLTTRRLPATPARPPLRTTLAGLSDAWQRTARGDTPDWTRLRGALDVLAQHPKLLPDALEPRSKPSGSAVMDALLAGIADKLADDARPPRPAWTKRTPRLTSE